MLVPHVSRCIFKQYLFQLIALIFSKERQKWQRFHFQQNVFTQIFNRQQETDIIKV